MYSKRNIARGCFTKMRYWRETSPPPPSPPPPSPTPDPEDPPIVDPSIPAEKPAINYWPQVGNSELSTNLLVKYMGL